MWADEVMHPSWLVPTAQACGGSAIVWGCCSWSALGSATLCAQTMRSADYLNILNDQVIPSMDFFFLTSLGFAGEGFAQWSDSPIINKRFW